MVTKSAYIHAADFMRSPSNDLRSPLRVEVIRETCMNKHKEIQQARKSHKLDEF